MTHTPRKPQPYTARKPNCRVHWRSLRTSAQGQSATTLDEDEARRAITTLNGTQAGEFHWWFVAEQPRVTIEPETNLELSQAVSE